MDGFDSVIEKVSKWKDKILGMGSAIRKAFTGSQSSINFTGKDPFIKANQDRLHKLEQTRKVAASMTGAARTAIVSFAALGAMFGADRIVGGFLEIGQALFDVDRQARHAGDSTERFMGFQYAVKHVGEDAQEATQALYNMYDSFLAAGNGSLIAKAAFRDIDRDLVHLAKNNSTFGLGPTEVLETTIDHLAKIKNQTEMIAKARRVFGENTKSMLPLIEASRNSTAGFGGRGIRDMFQSPIDKGGAISGNDVATLRETALKFEDAILTFKGAWTQIAIGMAPFAKMIANWINSFADGKSIEGAGIKIGAFLLTAFETGYNWLIDFVIALSRAFGWFTNGFLLAFSTVMKTIFEALNHLPKVNVPLDGIDKDIDKANKNIIERQAMEDRWEAKKYKPLIEGKSLLEGNTAFLGLAGGKIGLPEWLNPARKQQAELARNKPLYDGADQLLPSLLTPFEKYTESIEKLSRMQEVHALGSGDVRFGQGLNAQLLQLESSLGLMNVSLPTIARANTSQAESSVAKSRLEYDLKAVDSPQKRMERLAQIGNEIQGRTEAAVKELVKAQNARRPLNIKG